MRKYLKYIIPGVIILAVVSIVAYKIVASNPAADTRRQNVPLVKLEKPLRETVAYRLQLTGDVVPLQQANIFSKVNGNLERVYVNMGAYVRRDQLLALIDSTELQQQVQQTAATFYNARMTYQRTKQLLDQNLLAKQDLDNAEALMKVAEANYESAKTRLGYARVTAPFSGYITKRYLDPGAVVTPNSATLFMLMDLDSVKVVINVLEKDIPLITIGKRAVVVVDAFPGKEYYGIVARHSQAIDLSTRTMEVEIDVPNKGNLLKPGMFATVTLIVAEHPNAITVPTVAVLRDDNGMYVYVVENNTARRIRVKMGTEQRNQTEILSGLTGDESIITTGQQFVKDGGSVSVQP
jgi:RND family efflux transporter MFP subunit